ncbi:transporter substrate-binding domain-containing protein [Roseovarius sp. D0-M9]|uniref:transporter substrate-binding domain-containing protein n=1 Tax=Roseovarius sp. D0-M9 TaxID=3127117 RepID=UPI00300FDA92
MKFSVMVSIGLLTCSGAMAEELRIGTSADYPPWESVNSDNEIVGFDRDFGDELCKRIDADCTWNNQTFDGLLPGLQVGKFDAVISGISINEERSQMVDFTVAYADAPNNIVANSTSNFGEIDGPESLVDAMSGKTFGVQVGSTHEQVVRAHFGDSEVRVYDRPDQVVNDLIAGRIDAGLMERSAWETFVNGDYKDELKYVGPLLSSADFPEFGQGQAVALSKDSDELQGRMNEAIEGMLSDGTVAAMSEKWFGYDISAKN